jgi:hypothetical protein
MAPTFPPKSAPSFPSAITIHPGSGNFLLAEQHKDKTVFAFQQRNPSMAEKMIAATKRGESLVAPPKTAQSIAVFLTLLLAITKAPGL